MNDKEMIKTLENKLLIKEKVIEILKDNIITYQNTKHIEIENISASVISRQRYNLDISIKQLELELLNKMR